MVVLVDEYDKPILDALRNPELAETHWDDLRGLYGNVKRHDAHIRFALLTGVSKLSKVSLFSDLNNLTDLTLHPRYTAICGYTDQDLDTVFAPELPGLDCDAIRDWYNGYGWGGQEKVYNPFDILQLFESRRFAPYWFETATPTFLVETFAERGLGPLDLEGMTGTANLLSTFDVHHMAVEALLFQTGYLTILAEEEFGGVSQFRLGYPNREVRQNLNGSLLRAMVPERSARVANPLHVRRLLAADDFAALEARLRAFFAGIPHDWHRRNDMARHEGYYASVFYVWFAGQGLDVTVEDTTSRGRLDMAVRFGGGAYLFEFKVVEQAGPGAAMAQLKGGATPTSIWSIATRYIWSRWSSAVPSATWPHSRCNGLEEWKA